MKPHSCAQTYRQYAIPRGAVFSCICGKKYKFKGFKSMYSILDGRCISRYPKISRVFLRKSTHRLREV